jgi:hypothetical protein
MQVDENIAKQGLKPVTLAYKLMNYDEFIDLKKRSGYFETD